MLYLIIREGKIQPTFDYTAGYVPLLYYYCNFNECSSLCVIHQFCLVTTIVTFERSTYLCVIFYFLRD